MAKKKQTEKETFKKVEKKPTKIKEQCYTFIENVQIGLDIYGI